MLLLVCGFGVVGSGGVCCSFLVLDLIVVGLLGGLDFALIVWFDAA